MSTHPRIWIQLFAAGFVVACGPSITQVDDDGAAGGETVAGGSGDSGGSTTVTPPGTTVTPGTTTAPTSTSIGDSATTMGDETIGGETFISVSDGTMCGALPPGTLAHCSDCSTWAQDCPEGDKCVPWANDGGPVWNATRCSRIDEDPDQVGEPCTVEESPVSGVDSCELGAMCFSVDPETNEGVCVEMCSGDPSDPMCSDGATCTVSASGPLNLCIPACDPLAPECDEGSTCQPSVAGGFACAPTNGETVGVGETCLPGTCETGLACVSGLTAGCASATCCTAFCDLTAPDPDAACGGVGAPQVCVPWFDEGKAPPGYDHVGACVAAP